MLRREFLKVFGAVTAAICLPISWVKAAPEKPKKDLPEAVCPCCGEMDVTIENGNFTCHKCEAEGTLMVTLRFDSWPHSKNVEEIGREWYVESGRLA